MASGKNFLKMFYCRVEKRPFLQYDRKMTNPLYKLAANKMRREWAENDAKRDEGLSIPGCVSVCDNISYGPHGKDNLLCVYAPKDRTEELLPCIINIHGGGYFYGSKELYSLYSADMAARGFVVVVFNYRLCPENRYPAALEDINEVTKWVLSNASEFCIDPERIFVVGDSAGGQLALNYVTMLSNPSYAALFDSSRSGHIPRRLRRNKGVCAVCEFCERTIPRTLASRFVHFSLPDFVPKAVALNSALCVLVKDGRADEGSKPFLNAYLGSARRVKKNYERLDVQKYITQKFPPVFMMTAPNDFLFAQAKPQYELFTARGVKAEYKIYGTPSDDWASHVFHLNMRLPAAKQCNDDEAEFFLKNC